MRLLLLLALSQPVLGEGWRERRAAKRAAEIAERERQARIFAQRKNRKILIEALAERIKKKNWLANTTYVVVIIATGVVIFLCKNGALGCNGEEEKNPKNVSEES